MTEQARSPSSGSTGREMAWRHSSLSLARDEPQGMRKILSRINNVFITTRLSLCAAE
jgi:hypothetical protein